MTNTLPFSQYDTNKASGQSRQAFLRKLNIFVYDGIKWSVNFIRDMIKIALGK